MKINKSIALYVLPLFLMIFWAITVTPIDFIAKFSFIVSTVFFALLLICFFLGNVSLPLSCIFSFYLIFFIVAPLVQLNQESSFFVNTVPLSSEGIYISNLIAISFLSILTLSKLFFDKTKLGERRVKNASTRSEIGFDDKKVVVLALLSFFILLINFKAILVAIISDLGLMNADYVNNAAGAWDFIKYKFVFMLPFSVLCMLFLEKSRSRVDVIAIIICLVAVAFLKNPFTENRNAIGAIYLTLFAILFPNKFNKNVTSFCMISILILVCFPLLSIFTHNHIRMAFLKGEMGLVDMLYQFSSIHFDAWANLYAVVLMVQEDGYSYGGNILSALLFFVPRGLWGNKMEHSGTYLGDFLINNYSMWFNNLSFPLAVEFYWGFGLLGVVMGAISVGLALAYVERMKKHAVYYPFYAYLSFSMFFIMRGSFMPSYAFTMGGVASLIIVGKFLKRNN